MFKELEKQAYDLTIEIDGFPPDEYKYFDKLRILYQEFKYDGLPKDTAEKRKRAILGEYKSNKKQREEYLSVYKNYQNNIKVFHDEITAIEKSRDKNEIFLLALDAVGKFIGDESFKSRQKRKLEL